MTNKPDDRKGGGAMEMEDESVAGSKVFVAGTQFWTIGFSIHYSDS